MASETWLSILNRYASFWNISKRFSSSKSDKRGECRSPDSATALTAVLLEGVHVDGESKPKVGGVGRAVGASERGDVRTRGRTERTQVNRGVRATDFRRLRRCSFSYGSFGRESYRPERDL